MCIYNKYEIVYNIFMHDVSDHIHNLTSMLPETEREEWLRKMSEVRRSDLRGEKLNDALEKIKMKLHEVLPAYEILRWDDLEEPVDVDVVTIGRNVIHFDERRFQAVSLPTGTRIRKPSGIGSICTLEIGDDMYVSLRQEDFPKEGIHIQPRKKA